jgi:hypothetical protein
MPEINSEARSGVARDYRCSRLRQRNDKGVQEMASSDQFNAFIASRGEGLHPRLRQLFERTAVSPISEVTIRPDGMVQAGPDPATEAGRERHVDEQLPVE